MTAGGLAAVQPLTRRGIPIDPTLRTLALATLVNRGGAGAMMTTFALYFTRKVGFEPAQVGLALSLAGIAALLVQVPAGHLGDVYGPRQMLRRFMFLGGLASLGLLVTRDFWLLVVVLVVTTAFEVSANAVRNGYIARIAPGRQGVTFKAYLRAVTNVAIAGGALLGGIALSIDENWAYLAAFGINSVTTLLTAVVMRRLPSLPATPARGEGEPRLAVLRDHPYVLVTVLSGLVNMHFVVMEIGVALWISERTVAPTSMVALLLVLNTVAVAALQVRLSRSAADVRTSARAMVVGTLWIAGGFALIGLSGGDSVAVAVALLVAGSVVHVVGEMIASGGQWGLAMGLAPVERQGQYQGFAGTGFSLSGIIAPTLITLLCIEWGRPGWFVMAALMVLCGLAMVPASRWAARTRDRYGAASASL